MLTEKHLCKDCKRKFPTCNAEKIVWGIDVKPNAVGAEADAVVECDKFKAIKKEVNNAD